MRKHLGVVASSSMRRAIDVNRLWEVLVPVISKGGRLREKQVGDFEGGPRQEADSEGGLKAMGDRRFLRFLKENQIRFLADESWLKVEGEELVNQGSRCSVKAEGWVILRTLQRGRCALAAKIKGSRISSLRCTMRRLISCVRCTKIRAISPNVGLRIFEITPGILKPPS